MTFILFQFHFIFNYLFITYLLISSSDKRKYKCTLNASIIRYLIPYQSSYRLTIPGKENNTNNLPNTRAGRVAHTHGYKRKLSVTLEISYAARHGYSHHPILHSVEKTKIFPHARRWHMSVYSHVKGASCNRVNIPARELK